MTFTDNNNLQNSDRMNVAKLFDGVSEQVFSRSRIQYSGLVTSYDGQVIECSQFPASIGSNCKIVSQDGSFSNGEIIGFKENRNIIFQYEKY